MPQYNYLKNNFTAGQLGGRLRFRSDLVAHKNGCESIENMVVVPFGGLRCREGTKFIVEVKDSSQETRLIDFQFSAEDNYFVEMGNQYFRFVRNEAQVESGGVPYEISHSYLSSELFDVRYVQSADVLFMVHENHPLKRLNRFGNTNWTFTQPELYDGPYLDPEVGGTTLTLSATSGTITVTASAALFAATDTSGTGGTGQSDRHIRILDTGASPDAWIPCKIVSYTSATEVEIEIQDIPGETTPTFSSVGSPFDTFRLGAWSDTTSYPSTIAFYENRLIFGGSPSYPDTIWGSKVDDYVRFTDDVDQADNGFVFIAVSEKVNRIQWMSPNKSLRIGSLGAEFDMSGGSDRLSVGPDNVRIVRSTNYGSNGIEPLLIDNTTLFWQRSGQVLRSYKFDFGDDNFKGSDLTVISEGIARGKAKEMAFQLEPDDIVWVVMENGDLRGLTYKIEQEVIGWHTHLLGGTNAKAKSVAVIPDTNEDRVGLIVERTINGATKKYIEILDENFVYKTVRDAYFVDAGKHHRGILPAADVTPSGTTGNITLVASSAIFSAADIGKFIEVNSGRLKITGLVSTLEVEAKVLVDLASVATATAGNWKISTNTLSGLDHLEGETVQVLVDGGVHPNVTVSGGTITLEGQYIDIAVGLGYNKRAKILPIDYASNTGTQLGSRTRVTEATISVFESVGGEVGKDFDNLRPIFEKTETMGVATELQTKERVLRPKHDYADDGTFAFSQSQPLPLTINGAVLKVETSNAR